MKIFWTDAVGMREHGHSVIYLGTSSEWHRNDSILVEQQTRRLRLKERTALANFYAIFSRLEMPSNIESSVTLSRNRYLAGLLDGVLDQRSAGESVRNGSAAREQTRNRRYR